MRKATDGHYTIAATAILEQDIEQVLLTKIRPLNAKVRERLFDRALRFAGKKDLAFALSVIDEEFYDALRVINKVRNAFGHATTMQSFGDPEIADLVVLIPKLDSNIPDIKFRLLAKMKEIETHLQGVVAAANASPPK